MNVGSECGVVFMLDFIRLLLTLDEETHDWAEDL